MGSVLTIIGCLILLKILSWLWGDIFIPFTRQRNE
jgi:hypothetical protein